MPNVDWTRRAALIEIDPCYYRPTDVAHLVGDPAKGRRILGWRRRCGIEELVGENAASRGRWRER